MAKTLRVGELPQAGWGNQFEIGRAHRDLVDKLSRLAESRPDVYRRRVLFAALGGYAVILTTGLMLVAVAVLGIGAIFFSRGLAGLGIKIAFVCGLLAYGLVRSMAIKSYEPEGLRLAEHDAPRLFALIERIRNEVHGPKIHAVYVSDELNASMAQLPSFWIFGVRNTLTIGLPLMQTLSEAELASVIAHELGHSVGGHGGSAAFVYRVRMRWMQISEQLPSGWVSGALRRFFRWYGPWFSAYSFVLARSQEFEADRVAAQFASPEVAAAALTRIDLQASRFGEHWGNVWKESRSLIAPTAMPYARARGALRTAGFGEADLARALAVQTDMNDTHPSLADRHAAWSVAATLPAPIGQSAAETLLGELEERLVQQFDDEWWAASQEWWKAGYEQAQHEAIEYQRLQIMVQDGVATLEDHVRFIELVESFEGSSRSIEARRDALERFPDAHMIRFHLGTALLEAGENEGVQQIESAIASWPAIGTSGYRLIIEHLRATAGTEVGRYERLLAESEALDEIADAEASVIDEHVALAPLELDEQQRGRLCQALSEVEGLTWVAAGQRVLKTRNERQIIFAFDCLAGHSPQFVLDQVGELILGHGDYLGFRRTSSQEWLVKSLQSLEGSTVFVRH